MREGLGHFAEIIRHELQDAIAYIDKETAKTIAFSGNITALLKDYASSGKLLRGSLVLLGAELFTPTPHKDAQRIGVAVELMHCALLIQEDIMNNFDIRRKKLAFHKQVEQVLRSQGIDDSTKAKNIALCAADILIFTAMNVISRMENPRLALLALKILSQDLNKTAAAQMLDVSQLLLNRESILQLYLFKTARYTFSMPLMLGAKAAGQEQTKPLEKFGEYVGIIYQIRNDAADMFKGTANKVKAGKETLHKILLQQKNQNDLFGRDITSAEHEHLKKILQESGVVSEIDSYLLELATMAIKELSALPIGAEQKKQLSFVVEFVLKS